MYIKLLIRYLKKLPPASRAATWTHMWRGRREKWAGELLEIWSGIAAAVLPKKMKNVMKVKNLRESVKSADKTVYPQITQIFADSFSNLWSIAAIIAIYLAYRLV